MKRYTYKVICYVDVVANNEDEAIEKIDEIFPYDVDIDRMTIFEINDDDHCWEEADRFNDDRKLGI